MFWWPARRRVVGARFRSEAMTRGPLLVRVWLRFSSWVTSRTQWTEFSIVQCPRTASAMASLRIRPAGWEVMP